MVISESTALGELPLNFEVDFKIVLLVNFERHARLFALDSAGMPRIFHSQRPQKNEQGPDQVSFFMRVVED